MATMSAKRKVGAPPPPPPECIYTSCYCEENIYLLAQAFSSNAEADADWPWQAFVVFISNHGKTVRIRISPFCYTYPRSALSTSRVPHTLTIL